MDDEPENPVFPWLSGEQIRELTKVALGESDIWFDPKDKRFADDAWKSNPYFRMLAQSYRLFEQWVGEKTDKVDGSWEEQARARFFANIIAGAASPANYLLTNPVALQRAAETGGLSLWHGQMNMLNDMARGGLPRNADRTPFPVGEKIAVTPGAVVYREEMFELLQYAPSTPRVRSRPLLIVPPQINRHYILDLSPGRSLIEYAVSQGIQVFTIVWRNPRSDLGHGSWGLRDYFAAQEKAAEVVKAISRQETINWMGLCAGGMTTACMLGQMAARGDDSANSATYIVTMLANDYPNVIGMLTTKEARAQLEALAKAREIIPGYSLRTLFAFLRPNDLVYNYLVSGWLMGEDPAAFDVLAWNDDTTRATAQLGLDTARLVVDRGAGFPGVIENLPLITCDSFHVAGYTDHITPWRACYSTTQLPGGEKELCVVESGHIQSMVNPPATSRYGYWYGRPTEEPDPDIWLKSATEEPGSWWPRWTEWLTARSGNEKAARSTLGNRQYPPLGPAPGTYVLS